jgi:pimeloyl-ACP methyl ester carboxylesterase
MQVLRWIALVLLAAAVVVAVLYVVDMRRAYARIAAPTRLVATPQGEVEVRVADASGPAVLLIHGSGGGWDQGALIAEALLDAGVRWIAPSRFGYLRSTVRPGATFDDQADAYAHLLDGLGIRGPVAVLALSHGGPSALLFAARYPERVSALVLVSCGVASASDAGQAAADRKGDALTTIYRHDLLYWALSRFGRALLLDLMGASAEVAARMSSEQRALVDRVIDEMNPVAPRAAGVAFDHAAALPNERITAIRAPTLVVHAKDDGLQLFRNAEYAAARIPGARLRAFERGGHLVMVVEQQAIRDEVRRFIAEHSTAR